MPTPTFSHEVRDFLTLLVPNLQALNDPGYLMTNELPFDPGPLLDRAADLKAQLDQMPHLIEKDRKFKVTSIGEIIEGTPQPDEWQIEVASDTGKKSYWVRYDRVSHVVGLKENGISDEPSYACTCQDYLFSKKKDGHFCKHIWSVINGVRTLGQRAGVGVGQRPAHAENVPASVYDRALGAVR